AVFINGLPAPCLCALPGSVQHRDLVPAGHSDTQIVGRDLCTRSRSWVSPPISGCSPAPVDNWYKNESSTPAKTSDIIAYYV
ncbi:unnamed protein product, partial [Staurois parvus]